METAPQIESERLLKYARQPGWPIEVYRCVINGDLMEKVGLDGECLLSKWTFGSIDYTKSRHQNQGTAQAQE
jgi:hypothetical protein